MRLFGINSLAIGLHIGPCAVRLSDGWLSSLGILVYIAGQDLITEHDVIQDSDIPRIQAKYVRLISCIHSTPTQTKHRKHRTSVRNVIVLFIGN